MIDRDPLKKAWPQGYLAVRGVSTIGGWQCVDSDPGAPRWLATGGPRSALDRDWPTGEHTLFPKNMKDHQSAALAYAHKAGDLLPNVDPQDLATWACLLQDLAEAWNRTDPQDHKNVPRTLSLQGGLVWYPLEPICWVLTDGRTSAGFGRDATACEYLAHFTSVQVEAGIDTDDPAEALVLARILLREDEETP